MAGPFIGSEALSAGALTKGQLTACHTRLFRNVYVAKDIDITAADRAKAAWLWSRRRGVVAGFSAAALHGSEWVDAAEPAELIHDNRHRLPGLHVRSDRLLPDEIQIVGGVPVTTPARTAVDLACWHPTIPAVAGIDALARAAEIKDVDVQAILRRSSGRRGIARGKASLDLVDAGAESPKESWLRVILIQAGLPRPQTQILVHDDFGDVFARLDMGWPKVKVAAEYDGEQHRKDRIRYNWDVKRQEKLHRCGWIVIRVLAGDREPDIIRRVRTALAQRA
ncbi:type IV toxin-antitoxin system AbiEi family antitoxin [Mycobacterium branderi]|uniref:DUF559 domain-containing protein n=1 Tax=Mycobacterium branderi TaxID=43348 RepID=A0A7I7W2M0_9MYCO|nr:type IV toxin-antitoxin system AbiEi family antitoxin [Mycobacterium branderi]MCV7233871.1 hypothetical protein [Mycobacterium branderi]ORA39595.1 hypothetical protein BST20_08820 [Mycobacterium branderi]BBZ11839.1 hypothetical protein MBRA_20340 [Mycobacterium branderi]